MTLFNNLNLLSCLYEFLDNDFEPYFTCSRTLKLMKYRLKDLKLFRILKKIKWKNICCYLYPLHLILYKGQWETDIVVKSLEYYYNKRIWRPYINLETLILYKNIMEYFLKSNYLMSLVKYSNAAFIVSGLHDQAKRESGNLNFFVENFGKFYKYIDADIIKDLKLDHSKYKISTQKIKDFLNWTLHRIKLMSLENQQEFEKILTSGNNLKNLEKLYLSTPDLSLISKTLNKLEFCRIRVSVDNKLEIIEQLNKLETSQKQRIIFLQMNSKLSLVQIKDLKDFNWKQAVIDTSTIKDLNHFSNLLLEFVQDNRVKIVYFEFQEYYKRILGTAYTLYNKIASNIEQFKIFDMTGVSINFILQLTKSQAKIQADFVDLDDESFQQILELVQGKQCIKYEAEYGVCKDILKISTDFFKLAAKDYIQLDLVYSDIALANFQEKGRRRLGNQIVKLYSNFKNGDIILFDGKNLYVFIDGEFTWLFEDGIFEKYAC